jgi:hypothetical protein
MNLFVPPYILAVHIYEMNANQYQNQNVVFLFFCYFSGGGDGLLRRFCSLYSCSECIKVFCRLTEANNGFVSVFSFLLGTFVTSQDDTCMYIMKFVFCVKQALLLQLSASVSRRSLVVPWRRTSLSC